MPIELTMLAYSVALLFILVLVQASAGVMTQGLMPLAGSRDDLPPPGAFQARMKRVVDNHREGLILFAPLVLIAAHQGSFNDTTALGAQLFFYSRIAHAVLYIAGVPMIRPLAWLVGIAGTLMIFLALFNIA